MTCSTIVSFLSDVLCIISINLALTILLRAAFEQSIEQAKKKRFFIIFASVFMGILLSKRVVFPLLAHWFNC